MALSSSWLSCRRRRLRYCCDVISPPKPSYRNAARASTDLWVSLGSSVAAQYQINGIRRRLRCDHYDNRDLWPLVRTRNDGGKARQRPRGGGIKHLADVLDNDADFAAVEALVKPLVSSRKNPVNLAGVLPNITVPTGVRVYKAKPGGCFGDKPQYTASGIGDRSRPCIKAKLQRDARKKAMTNAATAPPPPPPTAAPPALPLLPHCRRRSHRRPGRDQHPPRDPQVRPGPVFAG